MNLDFAPSITHRMVARRVLRWVYKKMPKIEGTSPKNAKEARIDAILEEVIFHFDMSPILSGDSLQARLVAADLVQTVLAQIRAETGQLDTLLTEDDVMDRWRLIVKDQTRSLLAFQRHLQKRVANT